MNVQFTDKKESIFRSTLSLIKDNGFHGTPMSQIAKHANVAIGTIYHYFPSKDNLILELFDYCRIQLYDYIFKDVDPKGSYKAQFYAVYENFCHFHIQHRELSCFFEQFYNSPYNEIVQNKDLENGPYARNSFVNFLMSGVEQKIIKPLDEKVICAAYIGSAISYAKTIVHGNVLFNKKHLCDLIDIIWNGIKIDD